MSYDNWKLDYPKHYDFEPATEYCSVCSEPTDTENGVYCLCHCQDCHEELPEVDNAHCTNCCECTNCNRGL